jgi:hypothetical protein
MFQTSKIQFKQINKYLQQRYSFWYGKVFQTTLQQRSLLMESRLEIFMIIPFN